MKFPRLLPIALAASSLTLLSPARAGDKVEKNIQVGNRVAAKWVDGKYYIGTVAHIATKVQVDYDDGDKRKVPVADVFPIPKGATFQVGDHVLALWKKAAMYPGVISDVRANECMVRWDDGDQPKLVNKSKMLHWP